MRLEINSLASRLTQLVNWVAAAIAATFTWLAVRDAPLDKVTEAFDENSITKIALVFYFIGWVRGATADIEIERKVYVRGLAEIGLKAIGGILLFVAVYFALNYFHDRIVLFQAILLGFVATNYATWRLILFEARDMARSSEQTYIELNDNICLEKLHIVNAYMGGRWQTRRFITLAISAGLQLAIALLLTETDVARSVAGFSLNGAPAPRLLPHVPGLLFLAHVLLSEGWMFSMRGRAFAELDLIDGLNKRYRFVRR